LHQSNNSQKYYLNDLWNVTMDQPWKCGQLYIFLALWLKACAMYFYHPKGVKELCWGGSLESSLFTLASEAGAW
jgi:hypothetical protein